MFCFFLLKKQLVLSLVSNVQKKKKKKIRVIIRRQEFVHGSFPKHLMSISAYVPGRTAQVSAKETVGEEKKAELRSWAWVMGGPWQRKGGGNLLGMVKGEGGLPSGASGKEPACQCRKCKRHQFEPWVGKIPNPLQGSCLENPMDRGAWWATVQGIAKSWTRQKHARKGCETGGLGLLCRPLRPHRLVLRATGPGPTLLLIQVRF